MLIQWLYIAAAIAAGVGATNGPYSNSSSAHVTTVTAAESCTGCAASAVYVDVQWSPKVLYHTAATVVVLYDNTTNATQTTTIADPSFGKPTDLASFEHMVYGSVLSTELGGTAYSLTYPTQYSAYANVQVTEQYQTTNSAGAATCTTSQADLGFVSPSDPKWSGLFGAKGNCAVQVESLTNVLFRVSVVTATVTESASEVLLASGMPYAAPQPAVFSPTAAKATTTARPGTPTSSSIKCASSSSSSTPASKATIVNGIAVPAGGVHSSASPTIKPAIPSTIITAQVAEQSGVTENGLLLAGSVSLIAPPDTTPPAAAAPSITPAQPALPAISGGGSSSISISALYPEGTAAESQAPVGFITAGVIIVPAAGSGYLVNWKPLLPGGTPLTVNGQTVSLGPQGSDVVVGTKTAAVASTGVQGLGNALVTAGLEAPGQVSGNSFVGGGVRLQGGSMVGWRAAAVMALPMILWF